MNTENMTATEVLEARIKLNTLGETLERLRAKIDNARRLEWAEDDSREHRANTPFGMYLVGPAKYAPMGPGSEVDSGEWHAVNSFDGVAPFCGFGRTADEAKAYAERDWARRVDALLGGAL